MPLNVLQPESPCKGCLHNCCDPVEIHRGRMGVLSFPMAVENQRGELVEREWGRRMDTFEEEAHEIYMTARRNLDSRFSYRGVLIMPVENQDRLERRRERELMITSIRVRLLFYFDCSAYNKEEKTCGDYENRPKFCQELDVRECGLSSVAKPKPRFAIPFLGPDSYFSKRELASELEERVRNARPHIRHAIEEFVMRSMRKINRGLAR